MDGFWSEYCFVDSLIIRPRICVASVAKEIVDEKLTPTHRKVYKYKKNSDEFSIDLDNVVKAMLICAEEPEGQRYVASAIVACNTCQDVVETLVALGTTWLTHFLFVCQFSGLAINRNNP